MVGGDMVKITSSGVVASISVSPKGGRMIKRWRPTGICLGLDLDQTTWFNEAVHVHLRRTVQRPQ